MSDAAPDTPETTTDPATDETVATEASTTDAATDDPVVQPQADAGGDDEPTSPLVTPASDADADAGDDATADDTTASSVPKITTIPAPPREDAAAATPTARPRRRGIVSSFAIGFMVAVLGFGGGLFGWYVGEEYLTDGGSSSNGSGAVFQPSNDRPSARASSGDSDDGGDVATPREIYADVSPAVTHIDSRIVKETTNFFGIPNEEESSGTGSGFIIDEEGHVVTNAHVVEDASEITISLGVDNVEVPAKLVGADPSSDIAVLKFDPDADVLDGVELAVASFGDSEALQVGDPVLAIGNPFGLDRTLTTGVVSALQRNIPALNDFSISDVIQTDAAVNPGNSGGPLLNGQGEVIGVNSQISTRGGGFDGIAFAVPSSTVERVAKQLIESGSVEYAWLGVEGGELTPNLVEQLDLDVDEGVYLGGVVDGSPADRAGLEGGRRLRDVNTGETVVEGGDVLLKFDGEQLTSMTQLGALVDAKKPGEKVEIEYLRDGKRDTTTVTLGERPSASSDDEG